MTAAARLMRGALVALVASAGLAWIAAASDGAAIVPFSIALPGSAFPPPWRELSLPGRRAPRYALVADEGATVLRVRAEHAAGSLSHALSADPGATPMLAWRWKVDRVVDRADLARKEGDDYAARLYVYAARLYVFFDVPAEALSLAQRAQRALAKVLYGTELPTAAICYVWDNRHRVGTAVWNPYTDRVRMVVVRSGAAQVGQWMAETRDVQADFRAAFGGDAAQGVPRVTGVAVGADTDQTAESVTAWFGDLKLEAKR